MAEQETYKELISNADYNSNSALQIRLNTEILLDRYELFLKGKLQQVRLDAEGRQVVQSITVGEELANDAGVQGILSHVSSLINAQCVQGNMTRQQYDAFIFEVHVDICTIVMENLQRWGVHPRHYNHIIDQFMHMIIPFFTRLIDDGERGSFQNTLRTNENVHSGDNITMRPGWFNKKQSR